MDEGSSRLEKEPTLGKFVPNVQKLKLFSVSLLDVPELENRNLIAAKKVQLLIQPLIYDLKDEFVGSYSLFWA